MGRVQFRQATMGSDMVLAMRLGLVDDIVEDVGRKAGGFGLATCADVKSWMVFPSG